MTRSKIGLFFAMGLSNLGVLFVMTLHAATEPAEIIHVWPDGSMPGVSRTDPSKPEFVISDRRRPFYQLSNVSRPTIAVFPAAPNMRTGGAVLVCPGGGMQRLAYEHEGIEVADWLNPLGITVFVLKYRVPGPSSTALLDAQRAMGILRHRADSFSIDPHRISVMGFSAGGEVALLLATHFKDRGYAAIDPSDSQSCRPNHAALIYTGGIYRGNELRSDITRQLHVNSTPDMFIAHAFGDDSMNSLSLALQLKIAKVPCEMHIYQEGGHGFGARDSGLPLQGWKLSYQNYLASHGFMDKPWVAPYARALMNASLEKSRIKKLKSEHPDATMKDAVAVQRSFVQLQKTNDAISGFLAMVAERPASKSFPHTETTNHANTAIGVLFSSDRMNAIDKVVIPILSSEPMYFESAVGFIVSKGLDISTHIKTKEHIQGAFEAVVPIVIIRGSHVMEQENMTDIDHVASNFSTSSVLVGKSIGTPEQFDPASIGWKILKDRSLLSDEKLVNAIDFWLGLIQGVNEVVNQGYTLNAGDLMVCGRLSPSMPVTTGLYEADFSSLGKISFEVKSQD